MKHIVDMFKECEKIADYRKKIAVDPKNTREYEAQIWRHYTRVTELNDDYYEEKKGHDPSIVCAQVTFRSMEGKERVLKAFDINPIQRFFMAYFCCLDHFLKKKRLIQKGFLKFEETVDPQIILWENLGVSLGQKWKYRIMSFCLIFLTLAVSFVGQYYFQRIEKSEIDLMKSDCQGEVWFTQDHAWIDNKREPYHQLGLMNCYCQQMYDLYGEPGTKIIFPDGQQYCKDWFTVYDESQFYSPGLGAWIALTNIAITIIFQFFGKYKRGKDSSENYQTIAFQIFITMYFNTAILLLIAHNSFLQSHTTIKQNSNKDIFVGPYDEFNSNWYINIGSALLFAQAAMLVLPHIFTFIQSINLCSIRCLDRRCTWNTKKTNKIIQSEYEDLYTGPEFILHVRYAQVLSTIFVTFTYSSGMPILYALNFVILFIQYWVDKWLIFNYYRKSDFFTRHLSESIVNLLPSAVFLHILFALLIYSSPYLLTSGFVEKWLGGEDGIQYFDRKRLGMFHIFAFTIISCICIGIFLFEQAAVLYWR